MRRFLAGLSLILSFTLVTACLNYSPYDSERPEDDITIRNIDEFRQLEGLDIVKGNLRIEGVNAQPTDTYPLETVEGKVQIVDNAFNTLAFFPELVEVRGAVSIQGDASLTSIDLPKLVRAGRLSISNLDGLTQLNLPEFTAAKAFIFEGLPKLQSLIMPKVAILNADLDWGYAENIRFIGTGLREIDLPLLDSPEAEAECNLTISENVELETVRMAKLSEGSALFVEDNPKLVTVSLPNFNIKESKFHADGYVRFKNNSELTTIELSSLQFVPDILWFTENPKLANLNGLPKLQTIGKGINIRNNQTLNSVSGMMSLKRVQTINGEGVAFVDNPALPCSDIQALFRGAMFEQPNYNPEGAPAGFAKEFSVSGNLNDCSFCSRSSDCTNGNVCCLFDGSPSCVMPDPSNQFGMCPL